MTPTLERLANELVLGSLLDEVVRLFGHYEVIAHWTQGEFHHDLVLELATVTSADGSTVPGRFLVVATNCNGGVKEVLSFDESPDRWALWHWRCPSVADFSGVLPPLLGRATTVHFFDPCELLAPDARSELRPEFRKVQRGGGWEHIDALADSPGGGCGSKRE